MLSAIRQFYAEMKILKWAYQNKSKQWIWWGWFFHHPRVSGEFHRTLATLTKMGLFWCLFSRFKGLDV
jgi:hypothetical protein